MVSVIIVKRGTALEIVSSATTDRCAESLITSAEKENKTAVISRAASAQSAQNQLLVKYNPSLLLFFWLVGWQRRVLASTKLVNCKIFVRDIRLLKRFVKMVRELHRPS